VQRCVATISYRTGLSDSPWKHNKGEYGGMGLDGVTVIGQLVWPQLRAAQYEAGGRVL